MLQHPHTVRFRLADIQMCLYRYVQLESLHRKNTWLDGFLDLISGRGKKASVISRPDNDSTRKGQGKDSNRGKGGKTKTK